ncbi:restriction endonuclease subunit S [Shewanella sp.]|uniref:restriction endonuclease subunit S n=1 Tax=Shewanella sp. TaxID=50422 RepID=UPI001B6C8C5B|nr:restriction endonuclease subunit S [Shewanella sp.]MBP6518756.1 restriction endonuclease subunit S [Shewanella sp.]
MITGIEEKKRLRKSLVKGDVVIEKSGGSPTQPVGRVIYFENNIPFLYSNFTQKLSPIKNVNSKFMFYKLYFEYLNGVVLKFQQQTTGIINLQLAEYLLYKSLFPPLPEQQKIAAILTSVDEVIEKTQAQIDKLKDLKSGMMQELLTKGVGIKQGDKYEPHTEFKDSPVGRIPKSWDYSLLDKVAKRGSGHTPDKQKPEYWNGGIKWISLSDSSKLDNLHIHDSSKKISQLGIDNSSATLHPEGSVIMARDAGIGKSAIISSAMAVSQHLMAWVCGEKLNNYFLYYLLQLWKPTFENIAMGSTIKTIGLPYFKKLQIPVPPIEEQKIIADSLISVENKIFALQQKHNALSNTKKALMQDLLTGKVRVKVNNDLVS